MSRFGNEVAGLTLDGEDATQLRGALEGYPVHVINSGSGLSIISSESRWALTNRINALPLSDLGVRTITVWPATLNDVFLRLTAVTGGHELASLAASRAR